MVIIAIIHSSPLARYRQASNYRSCNDGNTSRGYLYDNIPRYVITWILRTKQQKDRPVDQRWMQRG